MQRALSLADELDIDVMNDRKPKNNATDQNSRSRLRLSPKAGRPQNEPYSPFKAKESGRSNSVVLKSPMGPKSAFVKFELRGDKKSPKKFID